MRQRDRIQREERIEEGSFILLNLNIFTRVVYMQTYTNNEQKMRQIDCVRSPTTIFSKFRSANGHKKIHEYLVTRGWSVIYGCTSMIDHCLVLFLVSCFWSHKYGRPPLAKGEISLVFDSLSQLSSSCQHSPLTIWTDIAWKS